MQMDLTTSTDLDAIEEAGLKMQASGEWAAMDVQTEHRFIPATATQPAKYLRTVTIPKGGMALGHKHLRGHISMLEAGSVLAVVNGERKVLTAPLVFKSGPGRKAVFALEDAVFSTVHVTDLKTVEEVEAWAVEKSPAFLAHERALLEKSQPALT